MEETCQECKFYKWELSEYVCKRYPPTTSSAYVGYGEWKSFTNHVPVDPDDGCGEYQEKETT